jgi:hypothetical protein
MKTCILRRELLTSESGTITLKTPTNFGTPKAAIFYGINTTAADGSFDTTTNHPFLSIGFAGDSGVSGGSHAQRCMVMMCEEDSDSSILYSVSTTSYVLEHRTGSGGTVYRRLSCDSFSTDTITCTLTNVTTPTEVCDVIVVVIGGDDVTVGVNSMNVNNTLSGNATFSTFTFQPDLVLFTFVQNTSAGGAQLNFGAVVNDGSLTQRNAGWCAINGAGTTDLRCGVNDNAVAVGRRGGSDSRQAVTAISSSGFTLQTQNATPGGAYPIYFLAIKSSASNFSLGTISGPINSGAQTQTIELPFVPDMILGSMTHTPTANINSRQTAGNADNFSVFVAKGETQQSFIGTGTLSYNPSSATVTGTSTIFTQQLSPGDKLYDPLYTLIGTVSSIASNTSLTLTALAAISPTNGSSYYYSKNTQFNLSYGDGDGNGNATSGVFTKLNATSAICAETSPVSANMIGKINDFTTRNEFNIQYTTLNSTAASGTAGRTGWYLAIKSENSRRRITTVS